LIVDHNPVNAGERETEMNSNHTHKTHQIGTAILCDENTTKYGAYDIGRIVASEGVRFGTRNSVELAMWITLDSRCGAETLRAVECDSVESATILSSRMFRIGDVIEGKTITRIEWQ